VHGHPVADGAVLVAAIIGSAGSVVGGLVGGWFVLLAGHRQWQRDAAARRAERSHAAALLIVEAVAGLELAIVIWAAGESDGVALRVAFNVFAQTVAVQGIALTDSDLRDRLRNHTEFVATLASMAGRPKIEAVMVKPVRRHADALISALEAHVNDAPLPAYRPPPLSDAAGLLKWNPDPAAEAPDDSATF
jgi:hypothetical protein